MTQTKIQQTQLSRQTTQPKLMTLLEFRQDYQCETGASLTSAGWSRLYSEYCEQESEAIAGGKYDVDPKVVREQQVALWLTMPFQVWQNYTRYCPYTDGMLGNGRRLIGGFSQRAAAEEFVAELAAAASTVAEHADEVWFTITPEQARVIPVRFGPEEECPF